MNCPYSESTSFVPWIPYFYFLRNERADTITSQSRRNFKHGVPWSTRSGVLVETINHESGINIKGITKF